MREGNYKWYQSQFHTLMWDSKRVALWDGNYDITSDDIIYIVGSHQVGKGASNNIYVVGFTRHFKDHLYAAGQNIHPHKSYLQKITYVRIMVDCSPYISDEFHNSLSLDICGKCFSSKYAYSRNKVGFSLIRAHFFHFFVAIDNSHDIQQLTLVLMDALHLKTMTQITINLRA